MDLSTRLKGLLGKYNVCQVERTSGLHTGEHNEQGMTYPKDPTSKNSYQRKDSHNISITADPVKICEIYQISQIQELPAMLICSRMYILQKPSGPMAHQWVISHIYEAKHFENGLCDVPGTLC